MLRPLPPYGVPLPCLHSVRTASPQPCFPLRRACRRVRPHADACAPFGFGFAESSLRFAPAHFSTIGRLPSGASASLRHRSAQRPLGCRGRCGARLARARWRLWDGSPLRHRGFRFSPRCAIHPRMRLAWLGRDTSLRPATPPRGVLRIPAQNPLWPRGQRRPIPPALFARCRRKRCRLHLSICAIHEPCTLLARVCLPCAERGVEAAARGGASADGGTRKTPRLRLRGATGGIPTKRLAAQARLYCAPYAVCARGSRQCAAESEAFGGKPRKERSD